MRMRIQSTRRNEQGQTIILVAIALIALLAMAALAIDVVTLYVARSEAQRVANAAAISAARMFASSGFTSVQGGAAPVASADACTAAQAQAQAVANQNTVAGQISTITTTCGYPNGLLNPQVNVAINRTGLPIFFARIWGRTSNSVNATAIAEAYNPSGLAAPISVSVKPFLIPNCDPSNAAPANPNCAGSSYFVDPNDGTIENDGNFIGKPATPIVFTKIPQGVNPNPTTGQLQYYPLEMPVAPLAPVCPSTAATSCTQVTSLDYLDNIACTSQYKVKCGDPIGPGDDLTIENNNDINSAVPATQGTQCLIHGNTVGAVDGQDALTWVANGRPITFTGGTQNPNPALRGTVNISRSDSIVTVPLYTRRTGGGGGSRIALCTGVNCFRRTTVAGFMQLGIVETQPPPGTAGSFSAYILNVSGCPDTSGNAVSGGGVSPVPVRLITQ
jgi:hypothetical protein